jgi:hypothetical protein
MRSRKELGNNYFAIFHFTGHEFDYLGGKSRFVSRTK